MVDIKDAIGKLGSPAVRDALTLAAAAKPALSATQQMQDELRKMAGVVGPSLELAKLAAAAKPALGAIDKMQEHARLVREKMQPTIDALGVHSTLARQLTDQFKTIDAFKAASRFSAPDFPQAFAPPAISPIPIVKNPIIETNKRLASIEKQFQRMETIAAQGADIATSLQASAADFLLKFEKASASNDRTTKRAVVIGLFAVFIAVVTPIAQIFYTEYWRAPLDAATVQGVVTDLKNDISALQKTQREASDRLSETMTHSNGELSVTLTEIRDLLAKQSHTAK